jgi:hypothetical protein
LVRINDEVWTSRFANKTVPWKDVRCGEVKPSGKSEGVDNDHQGIQMGGSGQFCGRNQLALRASFGEPSWIAVELLQVSQQLVKLTGND